MSQDYFSVAAGAKRDVGDAGEMTQHDLLQSTINLYDRCADIAVPQRTMQERVETCDGIASAYEPSGFFPDRVEADRVGAIRAGTSRRTSFGLTPFA